MLSTDLDKRSFWEMLAFDFMEGKFRVDKGHGEKHIRKILSTCTTFPTLLKGRNLISSLKSSLFWLLHFFTMHIKNIMKEKEKRVIIVALILPHWRKNAEHMDNFHQIFNIGPLGANSFNECFCCCPSCSFYMVLLRKQKFVKETE